MIVTLELVSPFSNSHTKKESSACLFSTPWGNVHEQISKFPWAKRSYLILKQVLISIGLHLDSLTYHQTPLYTRGSRMFQLFLFLWCTLKANSLKRVEGSRWYAIRHMTPLLCVLWDEKVPYACNMIAEDAEESLWVSIQIVLWVLQDTFQDYLYLLKSFSSFTVGVQFCPPALTDRSPPAPSQQVVFSFLQSFVTSLKFVLVLSEHHHVKSTHGSSSDEDTFTAVSDSTVSFWGEKSLHIWWETVHNIVS